MGDWLIQAVLVRYYGGPVCGVCDLHTKPNWFTCKSQLHLLPANYPTSPSLVPYTWLLSILQLNESVFDLALLAIIVTGPVIARIRIALMKHNDQSNLERKGIIWFTLPHQDRNADRAVT